MPSSSLVRGSAAAVASYGHSTITLRQAKSVSQHCSFRCGTVLAEQDFRIIPFFLDNLLNLASSPNHLSPAWSEELFRHRCLPSSVFFATSKHGSEHNTGQKQYQQPFHLKYLLLNFDDAAPDNPVDDRFALLNMSLSLILLYLIWHVCQEKFALIFKYFAFPKCGFIMQFCITAFVIL